MKFLLKIFCKIHRGKYKQGRFYTRIIHTLQLPHEKIHTIWVFKPCIFSQALNSVDQRSYESGLIPQSDLFRKIPGGFISLASLGQYGYWALLTPFFVVWTVWACSPPIFSQQSFMKQQRFWNCYDGVPLQASWIIHESSSSQMRGEVIKRWLKKLLMLCPIRLSSGSNTAEFEPTVIKEFWEGKLW